MYKLQYYFQKILQVITSGNVYRKTAIDLLPANGLKQFIMPSILFRESGQWFLALSLVYR